jgi:hypothetical protein
LLQARVKAVKEVQRVKTAMARQAEKEVATLKKELVAAQQKVKDAEEDLWVIMEGKFRGILGLCLLMVRSFLSQPLIHADAKEKEDLKKELMETKDQVKVLKEKTKEVRVGE